jgi:hypothetical protein
MKIFQILFWELLIELFYKHNQYHKLKKSGKKIKKNFLFSKIKSFFFKDVMENIFWGGEMMKLESVALQENKINEWREILQRAVQASLIPLKAYAEGRILLIK